MLLRFFPKETNFFDLFDRQVTHALDAARYLKEVVANPTLGAEARQKMKNIEHQGDEVAHDIIDRLDKTFITPFDREDIHSLVREIDDIIDMIYSIVNRISVYQLDKVDKNLIRFASVIEESVLQVVNAVKGMRNMKNSKMVMNACAEVNRLENVGDAMRDEMLVDLFERAKHDPVSIIKLKEVYQDAETVLDICEDVAHVVESILVKHA